MIIFFRCGVFNSWQYPCFPVLFNTKGPQCSRNGRSHATCSSQAYITSREQMNALSAFIDGSNIYSSDSKMFSRLRSKGKLFHFTMTIIINFCFLLNVKTSISLSSCFFYVIHQFVIVLPINYAISGFKLKVVITICCQNWCKKKP